MLLLLRSCEAGRLERLKYSIGTPGKVLMIVEDLMNPGT